MDRGGLRPVPSSEDIIFQMSRSLVTLLRHDPKTELLNYTDRAGWVAAENIALTTMMRKYQLSAEGVIEVAMESNKQKPRFLISEIKIGGQMKQVLKAVQGHSASVAERADMGSLLDEELKPGSKNWTRPGVSRHATSQLGVHRRGRDGYSTQQREERQPPRAPSLRARDRSRHEPGAGGSQVWHGHSSRSRPAAALQGRAKIFRSCTDVILTSGLWGLIPPQFIVHIIERRKDAAGHREVIYPSPSMPEAEHLRLFEAQEEVLDSLTATMVAKAKRKQYENIEEGRVNEFLEELERKSIKELNDTIARKRNRELNGRDRAEHAKSRLRMVYEFFGKKQAEVDAGIPFGTENADSDEDVLEEGETMWPAQKRALECEDREEDEVLSASGASEAEEDEEEEGPEAMSEAGESSSSSLDVKVIVRAGESQEEVARGSVTVTAPGRPVSSAATSSADVGGRPGSSKDAEKPQPRPAAENASRGSRSSSNMDSMAWTESEIDDLKESLRNLDDEEQILEIVKVVVPRVLDFVDRYLSEGLAQNDLAEEIVLLMLANGQPDLFRIMSDHDLFARGDSPEL